MLDAHTTISADATASPGEASSAPPAATPAATKVHQRHAPLPLRNDTLLGVCEAIGQDFTINANLFRIAFAIGLFFSPAGTVALYLMLGVAVAVSRWVYPPAKLDAASAELRSAAEPERLPLAA